MEVSKMSNSLNRANLRSRYRITGRLVMDTALHIGGGREASAVTDSPVVRNAVGEPFIPGSSLKGAFRAAVERLVPLLGLRTCQLADDYADCLSTNRELSAHYQVVRGQIGRELRDDEETRQAMRALQQAIDRLGPDSPSLSSLGWPNWTGQTIGEQHLLALLDVLLCDTCKTLGSVHLVSAAFFHDLPVDGEWHDMFQIRDGVGIDRDSERAKEQIKFDYEVAPPQTAFKFELTLENPSERDLGLIAIGLQEFVQGMVPIGGIRSRGLGRCHLEGLKVAWVDFTDEQARKKYLVSSEMTEEDGTAFIARHIGTIVGE
jgi:CRISPR/Cas system CSM-associated protein Csm3 (group 7 of RAMP superfamily)